MRAKFTQRKDMVVPNGSPSIKNGSDPGKGVRKPVKRGEGSAWDNPMLPKSDPGVKRVSVVVKDDNKYYLGKDPNDISRPVTKAQYDASKSPKFYRTKNFKEKS
jgi:hypothetical protein